ncbi:MAG: hypothetical protein OI715_00120 (plasmid) [Candidatus Methanoperedens sp.]|nr:MAG: hypothetical protein OI715_00120 [Candidatus Methanoperedens sp.]
MVIQEYGSVALDNSIKQILLLVLIATVLWPIVQVLGWIKNLVVGAFDLLINGANGVKNNVLSLVGLGTR